MSIDNQATIIKAFITKDQKNAFKSACALEGRTMNDVVEELLTDYTDRVHGKRALSTEEVSGTAA